MTKRRLRTKIIETFSKKSVWQVLLAVLMLSLCLFFVKNQHLELVAIQDKLENASLFYVALGLLFTIFYIFLQGLMYQFSFKAIYQHVDLKSATILFLKRNVVSVFLPAGGFSSLAFFTKPIEQKNVTKTQIHFASYIYGLCGIVSVAVVAIPTLLYMLFKQSITSNEIVAFGGLIFLIFILVFAAYSLMKEGFVYRLVIRYVPDLAMILDELRNQKVSKKQFLLVNLFSLFIEFVGIAHVYIAMLALGIQPSIEASIIAYVVMVMLLIVSPFLRGMGAIEVTMTYTLVQYGFTTVTAASVTLLFRFFEFWLPLLSGAVTFILKKDNLLLRILPSIIILILGIINIVSAITPSIPARLHLLESILPLDVINISNFLIIVFGFILIILSMYLLRGVKTAWWLAVVITALSVLGHIAKAFDYEEAILALISCAALIYTKKQYSVKPDPRLARLSITTFLITFGGVFLYGIIGFYFLDKRHFQIDFSWKESIKAFLRIFFLFDAGALHPYTKFGRNFLYSLYFFGFAAISFVLFSILRPIVQSPETEENENDEAQQLVEKYGKSSLDYFKTYMDKFFFFTSNREAFISYKVGGNYAIVMEDPVCETAEKMKEAIAEFEIYCRDNGLKALYYRVPETSLPVYTSLKKKHLIIGQEAVLDLNSFSLQGGKMKSIRNAIKKVETSGFQLKIHEPPIKDGVLQKLKHVSDEWLRDNKREELFFSQGIFDFETLKITPILTVENAEEQVVAFVNIMPDFYPESGTYDLIRKTSAAPNGSLDFLMISMFEYFKTKNVRYVNLGLATLSGIEKGENFTEKTMKFAYENIRSFSHYKGLRDYKEKFFPNWNNKYLIYDNSYDLLQIPSAISKIMKE
ncbi:MAG TPA: phosphatidylglycerol lysyltransferase domain-containing protein [Bacteroidia bacterium]|nr:phosphatidylglycerol lysyltransferase domain-containing protein [Bacteroidia bacterium]